MHFFLLFLLFSYFQVKKKVIETNLKNLNVAKFDLEFEVDPLFKKTACQFDEGRSGSGIFLNSLQLQVRHYSMVLFTHCQKIQVQLLYFCLVNPVTNHIYK